METLLVTTAAIVLAAAIAGYVGLGVKNPKAFTVVATNTFNILGIVWALGLAMLLMGYVFATSDLVRSVERRAESVLECSEKYSEDTCQKVHHEDAVLLLPDAKDVSEMMGRIGYVILGGVILLVLMLIADGVSKATNAEYYASLKKKPDTKEDGKTDAE